MGNVLRILTGARLLCRDPDGIDLTDDLGMTLINNHIGLIHQTLVNVQSELIVSTDQITTVAGTAEYSLSAAARGIMPNGVWKDEYPGNPLERVTKSGLIAQGYDLSDEAEPNKWYPVLLNGVGFCLTPDDAYTYNVNYFDPIGVMTATSDAIPYSAIFDQALIYWLAVEYKMGIGDDASYLSGQLTNAYRTAMQYIYDYGTVKLQCSGDMFSVDGV